MLVYNMNINNFYSPYFAEILGLLCAEGHYALQYSSYQGKDRGKPRYYKNKKSERIEFYNNDIKLLNRLLFLLIKQFNYEARIGKYNKIVIGKRDVIRKIIFETKPGVDHWRVPEFVKTADDNTKIAFIRGHFDGDGTASGIIRFFSCNKLGLECIQQLLCDLEFKSYLQKPVIKPNRKPFYTLQLTRKQKENFLNTIKPISKCGTCVPDRGGNNNL